MASRANLRFQPPLSRALPGICRGGLLLAAPGQRLPIQRLLSVPITPEQVQEASERWGLAAIAAPVAGRLATYGNLLLQWNARLSLTAIRDEAELVERHLMEGVFAAAHHPEASAALDFGSGAGIPGIPIALCRASIHVTLAESQRKKAAFLQEALRRLGLRASVHAG